MTLHAVALHTSTSWCANHQRILRIAGLIAHSLAQDVFNNVNPRYHSNMLASTCTHTNTDTQTGARSCAHTHVPPGFLCITASYIRIKHVSLLSCCVCCRALKSGNRLITSYPIAWLSVLLKSQPKLRSVSPERYSTN